MIPKYNTDTKLCSRGKTKQHIPRKGISRGSLYKKLLKRAIDELNKLLHYELL